MNGRVKLTTFERRFKWLNEDFSQKQLNMPHIIPLLQLI